MRRHAPQEQLEPSLTALDELVREAIVLDERVNAGYGRHDGAWMRLAQPTAQPHKVAVAPSNEERCRGVLLQIGACVHLEIDEGRDRRPVLLCVRHADLHLLHLRPVHPEATGTEQHSGSGDTDGVRPRFFRATILTVSRLEIVADAPDGEADTWAHMAGPSWYDGALLAAHAASSCSLLLYNLNSITALGAIHFEVVILLCKWSLEYIAGDATPDVVIHHVTMICGSIAAHAFPAQAYYVVYAQSIHLALALHYARRVSHRHRGGRVDRLFTLVWLIAVCSRSALFTSGVTRALLAGGRALTIALVICGSSMVLLDIQWTRETFERRQWPRRAGALVGCIGALLGAISGEHRHVASPYDAAAPYAHTCWAVLASAVLALIVATLVVPARGASSARRAVAEAAGARAVPVR